MARRKRFCSHFFICFGAASCTHTQTGHRPACACVACALLCLCMLRLAAMARRATAGAPHRACGATTSHTRTGAPSSSSSSPSQCPLLVAANVYISEGRRVGVLDAIVAAIVGSGAVVGPGALPWSKQPAPSPSSSRPPTAALLHAFPDAAYNRTGFTLVGTVVEGEDGTGGPDSPSLTAAVLAASRAGCASVDLRTLRGPGGGDHPTLGVVDHVAVHPLGCGDEEAGMAAAVAVARGVGSGLGDTPGVPTFLYGATAVDPSHATLASLRRALGYFRPPLAPGGAGGGGRDEKEEASFPPPDFGPTGASASLPLLTWGRASVGATPWVVNWNVPIKGKGGALDKATAAAIARAVSSRGGSGLVGVEALALPHAGDDSAEWPWEVAANLRAPGVSGPAELEVAVVARAAEAGVEVGAGYNTGLHARELEAEARRVLGGR